MVPYESVYYEDECSIYDKYYDCYICPNNQGLSYYATNRDGYREYRSDPKICVYCPHLAQCTISKAHIKTVARHVWAALRVFSCFWDRSNKYAVFQKLRGVEVSLRSVRQTVV